MRPSAPSRRKRRSASRRVRSGSGAARRARPPTSPRSACSGEISAERLVGLHRLAICSPPKTVAGTPGGRSATSRGSDASPLGEQFEHISAVEEYDLRTEGVMDAPTFYNQYFVRRQPVILRGGSEQATPLKHWTDAALLQNC